MFVFKWVIQRYFKDYKKYRKYYLAPLIGLHYLILFKFLARFGIGNGIHTEHVIFVLAYLAFYFAHPKTRQWAIDFLPFFIFVALYDILKLIPLNWRPEIHVAGPYNLELALFGISSEGARLIPCDFFKNHTHLWLDVYTALIYFMHLWVPIFVCWLIWLKDKLLAKTMAWCFLVTNLFAFATYISYPVAAPWYVENFGFAPANWAMLGDAAGLKNFDLWIGAPYFATIYAKAGWVFGAIPSMHAGFPVITSFYARKAKWKAGLIPVYLFLSSVWFAAVYLRHHYIIDLLAGALYAGVGIWLTERWLQKKLHPTS